MGLRIVVDSNKKATGIFIPISEFQKLRNGIKMATPLYKMMDELTYPEEAISYKQDKINGLCTIEEQKIVELYNTESHYIKLFIKNKPIYYKDERCVEQTYIVKANADGSEYLIDYNWNAKEEKTIIQLALAGEGKFAYLLSDARYLKEKYSL